MSDGIGPTKSALGQMNETLRHQLLKRQILGLDKPDDRIPEDVRILTVVEHEGAFFDIGRKMLGGQMMIGSRYIG